SIAAALMAKIVATNERDIAALTWKLCWEHELLSSYLLCSELARANIGAVAARCICDGVTCEFDQAAATLSSKNASSESKRLRPHFWTSIRAKGEAKGAQSSLFALSVISTQP